MGSKFSVLKKVCLTKANLYRVLFTFGLFFYCLFGAACFNAIEGQNETETNQAHTEAYKSLLMTYTNRIPSAQHVPLLIELVYNMTINNTIKSPTQSSEPKWDFYGSFYFASTVITTIGFGNVAPKTKFGRIFCVFYALMGIPLCLITLNKLSDLFAAFRGILLQRTDSKFFKAIIIFFLTVWWMFVIVFIPALCFTTTEPWDIHVSLYFCFVTLSTIGFGDYIATGQRVSMLESYRFLFFIWALIGLAYISNLISAIQNDMHDKFVWLGDKICCKKTSTKVTEVKNIDTIGNYSSNTNKRGI